MAQPSYKTLQDTSTPIERITREDIGKLPQVDLQDLENLKLPSLDLRDNRSLLNDAERAMNPGRYTSVEGTSVEARAGDSISRILGTSDPQAIGNFMRANNLTGDGIQAGRSYFLPSSSTAYGDSSALGQAALNLGNARLAARDAMVWGDSLSFDGSGLSFSDVAVGGAASPGGVRTLGGWQRTQAHALGVYDAGVGAVEGAGYSFGVVGSPESRAAWAIQTADAGINGLRHLFNDPKGTVSGWWDNLTGDDPAAIRQATAQGTGVALGVTGGVVMGRLSSGGLASTGARSLSLAEFERQLAAAERAYGEIRLSTTDIQSVAQNTGLKEFQVARVKNHLFLDDTHQLSTRIGQFDADFDIASAWRRMEAGTHTFDDIKLFKHEYFESKFEKIFRTNYETAHNAAQKRYPSPLIDY